MSLGMERQPHNLMVLLLITSALLIPVWVILTEPYVVEPSPLKLFEAIHPTYYAGLIMLALSLIVLSIKPQGAFRSALNLYLATALLSALYIQLPLIALFEHPVSDHTIHLVPTFYMLREGNINMPDYPLPETVTPQLFASILIMVTSLPNSLENLHRISVLLLPLLTTLYVYLFMRRIGVNERFAMMASVLNMGLMHISFMFLRQTYAMPLYIMLALLVLMALRERRASFSLLAIITSVAFVMSDPAHVMLTIIPLAFFAVTWVVINLVGKNDYRRFKNPWILVAFISVAFLFLIINRHASFLVSLGDIARTMLDIFIRSINELAYPLQTAPAYWGKSTALKYGAYNMLLYQARIALIAFSIILPMILLVYTFLSRKTRSIIFRYETIYLASYFLITAIVIVMRGYGITYTPWAVMTTFYMLSYLNKVKQRNRKMHQILTFFAISFLLTSIIIAPHIIYSGGRIRLPTADIYALSWLGRGLPQTSVVSPGYGGWLSEFIYITMVQHISIGDYLFYEGLTPESLDRLAKYDTIIIPESALMHFEGTEDSSLALEAFKLLAYKLGNSHNLVYSSGYPFFMIWLASEA